MGLLVLGHGPRGPGESQAVTTNFQYSRVSVEYALSRVPQADTPSQYGLAQSTLKQTRENNTLSEGF